MLAQIILSNEYATSGLGHKFNIGLYQGGNLEDVMGLTKPEMVLDFLKEKKVSKVLVNQDEVSIKELVHILKRQ